ncbi:hypothetical protein ACLOJK_025605 [Asimina triloba]
MPMQSQTTEGPNYWGVEEPTHELKASEGDDADARLDEEGDEGYEASFEEFRHGESEKESYCSLSRYDVRQYHPLQRHHASLSASASPFLETVFLFSSSFCLMKVQHQPSGLSSFYSHRGGEYFRRGKAFLYWPPCVFRY